MQTNRQKSQPIHTKFVCICIVCIYLLHPFGNKITQILHQTTHISLDMTGKHSDHHHHHSIHFALDGNHFLASAEELTKGHHHPIINFLSAAFDFQESLPDSQKQLHLTLDLHLISQSGEIPKPPPSSHIDPSHFIFNNFLSGYHDIHTPPPRTTTYLG